ncbi:hypothetical protein A6J40_11395 [Legionella longbeachae]|uniref:Uncharacterized protein n=1 Tax=Legionella longbeachae serogroup 1 (strain NSW150) TaxID=661367 RepID=D3HN74_LEGLN|nr:hypothetical protein A6J40_11395 [Legionella longbeachae]CBJ10330.1 hypothetical protein LLO_0009 [Legionella longbeachae NSW150]
MLNAWTWGMYKEFKGTNVYLDTFRQMSTVALSSRSLFLRLADKARLSIDEFMSTHSTIFVDYYSQGDS